MFHDIFLLQKQGKKELLHNPEPGVLAAEDHPGLRGENCAVQHLALRAERGSVLKRPDGYCLLFHLHGPLPLQRLLHKKREEFHTQEHDRYKIKHLHLCRYRSSQVIGMSVRRGHTELNELSAELQPI